MGGGQSMKNLMGELMARYAAAGQLTTERWDAVWRKVSGRFAEESRCGKLRRGVLEIMVLHSTTLQEMAFHKENLLIELRKELPDEPIEDIRFRIGPVA